MNETVKAVQDFAGKAHGEQMRHYTPDRYIVHPIQVMQLCTEYTQDETMLAAALLHDVLEDTQVNKEAMLCFLLSVMEEDKAKRTLGLVIELTDVYTKKKYPTWNRRKRKAMEASRIEQTSSEAQTIKYADILDNINELPKDDEFSTVFLKECRSLLKRMNKGETPLYKRTVEAVKNRLKEFQKTN